MRTKYSNEFVALAILIITIMLGVLVVGVSAQMPVEPRVWPNTCYNA